MIRTALILCLLALTARGGKPNFLFIMADDCTFRDIGCYGGQAHTPNIDRVASEGMKFERCFQAAPMCSPTRHNLYTGIYPVKSGAYPNHTQVYPQVRTVAHHLQPAGYRVALSGKSHVGPASAFPWEVIGADANNPDFAAIDGLFAEAAKSGKPFCLFACSNEPHSPWNKGDASRYPPAKVKLPPYIVDTPLVRGYFSAYLAEITYFDDQVGRLLALLDQHGLADNTLVMVVSEQGNQFPFAKWTCYDNGLQSAMVVRWPGTVTPGSVTNAMVEYTDVLPTFVDAAGGKPVAPMDGRSFLPVLRGETDRHKDHVFGIMTTRGIIGGSPAYTIRSVRSGTHKLIVNFNHDTVFTNACVRHDSFDSMIEKAANDPGARRLVEAYQRRPPIELYDVVGDPLEMTNLADKPELAPVIAGLRRELDAWMEAQGDEGIATELKALERQPRSRAGTRGKQPKKRKNAAPGNKQEEAP